MNMKESADEVIENINTRMSEHTGDSRTVSDDEVRLCILASRVHELETENLKLLEELAAISNMCIGEIAMGRGLCAQSIGEGIYQVTGMTNPQLNDHVKKGLALNCPSRGKA